MAMIALIPARGGSKGIPRKNILPISGKPLIAWSIEHALKSSEISDVYVSTDCEEIAKISKEYGAKVPFIRPADISSDAASTESVMLHFCDYLYKHNIDASDLVLLQCTSPIRHDNILDDAIKEYKKYSYDSLLSVSESHRFFWKNRSKPEALYDFNRRPRRQDINEEDKNFLETGSFYISNLKKFIDYKNRLFGKIGMFVLSEEESFEIDSPIDFLVCETILKNIKDFK